LALFDDGIGKYGTRVHCEVGGFALAGASLRTVKRPNVGEILGFGEWPLAAS
jgi:hypothetical protein